MCPNWDRQTRGQNRKESDHNGDRVDYDGLSCMEIYPLRTGTLNGVEDTTVIDDLVVRHDDSVSE